MTGFQLLLVIKPQSICSVSQQHLLLILRLWSTAQDLLSVGHNLFSHHINLHFSFQLCKYQTTRSL